ncbi:hypothetical protein [Actinophytocola sediminis]
MTHPNSTTSPVQIYGAYKASQNKPPRVAEWERQIDTAGSYEQSQAQLLYNLVVETHRLRMLALGVLVIVGVSFVLGAIGVLVMLSA